MKLTDIIEEKAKKIGINFDRNSYRFMDEKIYNPILITLGGSWAYGTNIETSDVDIRGIAQNTSRNILLMKDFEQVCDEKTDTTIYSLEKIVKLLSNCNPNTIEMLGTKDEHILFMNPIGKRLIENKEMFLSKRLLNSFLGYANQQFYWLRRKTLYAFSKEEYNEHVLKVMKNMTISMAENFGDCMDSINLYLKDDEICMDLNMEKVALDRAKKLVEVFNKTYADYCRVSKNKEVVKQEKICKHSMHLLRLLMTCLDILLKKEINTYREEEHDLLMQIRNGDSEWFGNDGKPNKKFLDLVENYNIAIEEARKITKLPDNPDIDKINDFVISANYEVLTPF